MITFGFKNKFGGWLRTLIALVIGILIICFYKRANLLEIIVKIFASLIMAAGVVTLIMGLVNRKKEGISGVLLTNAVIDVAAGIVLFVFARPVAHIMVVLLGIAVIVFALWEIIAMASAFKVANISLWSFILPVISVLVGVAIILFYRKFEEAITLVTGIALIIYAISEGYATITMNRAIRIKAEVDAENEKLEKEFAEAEEAEFKPVDE